MADNVVVQSATLATLPPATPIAARAVTYSGDAAQLIAPVGLVTFAGADDAKTATDVTGTNPLPTTGGTLTPAAPTFATVGVASAEALAADATRKGYDLVSTATGNISLAFGASPAVLYSGITLSSYGSLRVRGEFATLAVNAIASAAASNLGIQAYT
jgi:hypothetical protein